MTGRYIVAICDDENQNRELWRDELGKIPEFESRFEVQLIIAEALEGESEFKQAIDGLAKRRARARDSEKSSFCEEENLFDKIDLLIVDYDLIKAVHGRWITGEEIAYLARCYSRCKTIVAVNQFGSNPFDLNLTGRFPDSFADVNLGDKQVTNPGLWSEPSALNSFRPWYWPLLPKLISDMEARIVDVQGGNLDRPIKDVLGFNDEAWRLLPRETIAYITPRNLKKAHDQLTVRDVIEDSEIGLRPKDKPMDDDAIARIAASRLGQWLDYAVLAAQDILVDAPHLVERYPSLTGATAVTIEKLNEFARIASPDELRLEARLAELAFTKSYWLSRPAWYWPLVTQAEWIEEVRNPWGVVAPDAFFCEDVSRFEPMANTREFRIRVSSVYDTRRCIDPDAEGAKGWKQALEGVDYQPNSRLMD